MTGGGSICVLPSAGTTPVDRTVPTAYWECWEEGKLFGNDPSEPCYTVLDEFADATGCGEGTACREKWSGPRNPTPAKGPRDRQCQLISTIGPDGPFKCVETRITTPCPEPPMIGSGPASADAPEAAGSAAEPSVAGGATGGPSSGRQENALGGAAGPPSAPVATDGAAESVSWAERAGAVAALWGAIVACVAATAV